MSAQNKEIPNTPPETDRNRKLRDVTKNIGAAALKLFRLMPTSEHDKIVQGLLNEVESDPLTGILNKKYFFEKSNKLLESMRLPNERAVIMLMDLDKFKPINDTYGHEVGDRCLKLVAEFLRDSTRSNSTENRPNDLVGRGDRQNETSVDTFFSERSQVARLGGDEFGIAMHLLQEDGRPVVDPTQAAESIKERLEHSFLEATKAGASLVQKYGLTGIDLSNLSMSIGYTLATKEDGIETLLDSADANMYTEKQRKSGTNTSRIN